MRRPKPPWPLWGWFGDSQTGGIPQCGRFPHGFVLSRSTSCESLSHGYAVPAPFGKGAFGVQRRSPPGHCGGASACRGGGIPQGGRFPHRFVLTESANCESLSHGCAVPAPFGKGALRAVPADNAHGSFLLLVTSLTRPVSFYGAIPGFFRLSIDSVGKKCS